MEKLMTVGQIINTHGLKGELKVYPLTDDPKRFRKLKAVIIEGEKREIVWCKIQNEKIILKIAGIETIEEAEKYKNKYLEIEREEAIKLPKGSYFISDLIGCTVYDEEGVNLGKVFDVIQTPSNDVYWIKEGKELLIPALKTIVVEVNIEEKKIVIKPTKTWLAE